MELLKSVINKAMEDHQIKITIGADNKQQKADSHSKAYYGPFILGLVFGAGMASAGFLINESAAHAYLGQARVQVVHQAVPQGARNKTQATTSPATAPEPKTSAQKSKEANEVHQILVNQNNEAKQVHDIHKIVGAGIMTTIFGLTGGL